MDVSTGKDGAVTAIDGRLFHTGTHRENERAVVLNNLSTRVGERLYVILWDFPLVQEVFKDNSRRAKRLNYTGSYKKVKDHLECSSLLHCPNLFARRTIRLDGLSVRRIIRPCIIPKTTFDELFIFRAR